MRILLTLVALFVLSKAQSPQDIAEIACASITSIYEFNSNSGYVESPGYPDVNYVDNEDCQWYINPTDGIPAGQEIYLEVVYFQTESCCDEIFVYEGRGISGQMKFELAGTYTPGQFFPLGNEPVTLYFETDGSVDYDGFRVHFYIGEESPGQVTTDLACDDDTRPVTLYNSTAILETPNYPIDYPSGTLCEWIIEPDNFANGIYINVLDFYAYDYLYVYFNGVVDPGNHDTYLYGSLANGHSVFSPGSTLALRFEGDYADPGFQIVYYQADPACTGSSANILDVGEKAELKSPGYPYDIPERLSCRWLLQAPAGQKVLLTSLALDLYGNGLDCADEYVEILDGNTVDSLSLGLFCGNQSFGVIPSTSSALQVYLRTHETATDVAPRTGFRFEYELN